MDNDIATKLESYFRSENDVVAVYLFGSAAEGKARPTSDIDIGVLFDRANADIQDRLLEKYLTELPQLLRKDVHLVVLNRAGEELMRQVYAKGKLLVVNKPKKLAEFNMIMVARIVDFSYYRELIQKGFAKRVLEGRI
jgi:predicted nucleotidyltransferase